MDNIFDYILAILSGICVCIPLVKQIVTLATKYTQEKNWIQIVNMVLKFMEEAEKTYNDGQTKKEYVMNSIKAAAVSINYELTAEDLEKISKMIDDMCSMSKVVNAPNTKE